MINKNIVTPYFNRFHFIFGKTMDDFDRSIYYFSYVVDPNINFEISIGTIWYVIFRNFNHQQNKIASNVLRKNIET